MWQKAAGLAGACWKRVPNLATAQQQERKAGLIAWQLLLRCSISPLQGAQIGLVWQLPRGQRLFDTRERSACWVVAGLLAEQVLQTNRAAFAGFHSGQGVRVAALLQPREQPGVSLKGLLKSQSAFCWLLSFQAFQARTNAPHRAFSSSAASRAS
jgi:hypothetical protein